MSRALSIAAVVWGGICFAALNADGSQPATKQADEQPTTSPKAKHSKPQDRDPKAQAEQSKPATEVRWKSAENRTWQWYERETLVDGRWEVTGVTTPVHRQTGKYHRGPTGYLELSAVPHDVRRPGSLEAFDKDANESEEPGKLDPVREAREGRPASKWIRSLGVKELREWLSTNDIPEAGVDGMTQWEHLTRDHGFDPVKIEGLTEEEQAELHGAAHAGY